MVCTRCDTPACRVFKKYRGVIWIGTMALGLFAIYNSFVLNPDGGWTLIDSTFSTIFIVYMTFRLACSE